MTFTQLRNALVERLWSHLGCPVVLANQVQPEPVPPFGLYTVTASCIPTGELGGFRVQEKPDGTAEEIRMEMPSATFSFTFCSWDRDGADGTPIHGADEAEDLAWRASAWFQHTGYDEFLKLGVAVAEVGQVQDRTVLVIDEAARRYGFDVRIRYTRQDTRTVSTVDRVAILQKKE